MGRFSSLNKNKILSLEDRADSYNTNDETIRLYGFNTYSLEEIDYELDKLDSALEFFNELTKDKLAVERYQELYWNGNLSLEQQDEILNGLKDIYNRHKFMKPSVALESFNSITKISLEFTWDDFTKWISELWDQVCNFFKKTEDKISDRAHDKEKESTIDDLVRYIKDNADRLKEKSFDVVINEEGPEQTLPDFNKNCHELTEITNSSMAKLREVVNLVGNLKTSKDADQVNIKLTSIEKGREDIINKLADLKKVGKIKDFRYEGATQACDWVTEGHKKWLETFDAFTKEMDEKIKSLKESIVDAAKSEALSDPKATPAKEESKYVSNMSPDDPKLKEAREKQAAYENKQNQSSNESYGLEDENTTTDSSTTESPQGDQAIKDDLAVTRMDAYNTSKQGATAQKKAENLNEGAKKFIEYLTKSMQLTLKDNNFYLDVKDLVFKFLLKWKEVATGQVGDINAEKAKQDEDKNNRISQAEDAIMKNKDKIEDDLDWLKGNKSSLSKTLTVDLGGSSGATKRLDTVFKDYSNQVDDVLVSASEFMEDALTKVKNGSLTIEQVNTRLNEEQDKVNKALESVNKINKFTIDVTSAINFATEALKYADGNASRELDNLKSTFSRELGEAKKGSSGEESDKFERRLKPLEEAADKFYNLLSGNKRFMGIMYEAFNKYMEKVKSGDTKGSSEEKKAPKVNKAKANKTTKTSSVSTDSYQDFSFRSIFLS